MSSSFERLPHLETFSQAAELGSFTAAGKVLGITQAAVSQRISALEKSLGCSLFQRRAGRIYLTEAGQTLYGFAQDILQLHREAHQEITGQEIPLTGELLLAASSIPGEYLLPGILAVFRKRYPEIQVRATQLDSSAVLDMVEQRRVHLGMIGGKSESEHLEFEAFAADEMVMVVAPDHRWRRRKKITIRQFQQEPLILRERGSGSRRCLEQALAERRLSTADLTIAMELGGNEAIKEAVAQGLGAAVLSRLAVRRELEAGRLHQLLIDEFPLDRTLYFARDKRRALPAAARVFCQFLRTCSTS